MADDYKMRIPPSGAEGSVHRVKPKSEIDPRDAEIAKSVGNEAIKEERAASTKFIAVQPRFLDSHSVKLQKGPVIKTAISALHNATFQTLGKLDKNRKAH